MSQEVLFSAEETRPPIPPGGCTRYTSCGNMTPGGTESANQMCDECLQELRHADRKS